MVTDPPDGSAGGGSGAATTPSDGSIRRSQPVATGPDTRDPNGANAAQGAAPGADGLDASALSGLLGAGQAIPPASAGPAASTAAPGELEAAPAGHDRGPSASSVALLVVAMVMLAALAGGVAVRWWAGRSARYWPA